MTQIAAFKDALQKFEADCGHFPSTAQGLGALIKRPAELTEMQWRGPYLQATIYKAPWGHDYIYSFPGLHNVGGFDLYSFGPDGTSKTGGDDEDDISNWPKHATLK